MTRIEQTARDHGFLTKDELRQQSTTSASEPSKLMGMDVVSSPIMPEGWFAMRADEGALCVGPKGSFWVPFPGRKKEPSE